MDHSEHHLPEMSNMDHSKMDHESAMTDPKMAEFKVSFTETLTLLA